MFTFFKLFVRGAFAWALSAWVLGALAQVAPTQSTASAPLLLPLNATHHGPIDDAHRRAHALNIRSETWEVRAATAESRQEKKDGQHVACLA